MDIQRVNSVLVKAIEGLQAGEVEHLWEFSVPSPADVARRTGMPLPAYKPPTPGAMHAKTGMPLTKKKPGRKPGRKAAPKAPVNVNFWLAFLNHKLTRWDMTLSKRERVPNIYRLGHLLGASEKVEKDMRGLGHRDDDSALDALRKSLGRRFEHGFPPIKAVLKAMDTYLKTGRRPKLGGGTTKPRSTKTAKVGGAPKKTTKKPEVSYWDQLVKLECQVCGKKFKSKKGGVFAPGVDRCPKCRSANVDFAD